MTVTELNTNETIEIKTATNIRRRFLAAFIDYGIINTKCYLIITVFGTPDENGNFHLSGWPALIPLLIWAFWTIGLEQYFGATLGNSIVNLKPISLYNSRLRLTFSQSLKRHLLDPIDMFFFGLIAYLIIKNTEKNQRLGDLWANTTVIKINN